MKKGLFVRPLSLSLSLSHCLDISFLSAVEFLVSLSLKPKRTPGYFLFSSVLIQVLQQSRSQLLSLVVLTATKFMPKEPYVI